MNDGKAPGPIGNRAAFERNPTHRNFTAIQSSAKMPDFTATRSRPERGLPMISGCRTRIFSQRISAERCKPKKFRRRTDLRAPATPRSNSLRRQLSELRDDRSGRGNPGFREEFGTDETGIPICRCNDRILRGLLFRTTPLRRTRLLDCLIPPVALRGDFNGALLSGIRQICQNRLSRN